LRKTVIRGPVALVDAVSIGLRASTIAASVSTGTDASGGVGVVLGPVAIGVLGVFIVLPGLFAARWDGIGGDVAEAAIRAAMLLVYLFGIGRSAFVKRLFGYHGAEHMTIAAYERLGRVPTMDEVRRESPIHVRCGTDFIALFVISCGVVFSFVAREPMWFAATIRVVLLPAVMAMAYEVMRAAARFEGSVVSRAVTWPGRALQHVTTREPSEDMIDIAVSALRTAVDVPSRG
jgi:uncharacterized protein YqhQ